MLQRKALPQSSQDQAARQEAQRTRLHPFEGIPPSLQLGCLLRKKNHPPALRASTTTAKISAVVAILLAARPLPSAPAATTLALGPCAEVRIEATAPAAG